VTSFSIRVEILSDRRLACLPWAFGAAAHSVSPLTQRVVLVAGARRWKHACGSGAIPHGYPEM